MDAETRRLTIAAAIVIAILSIPSPSRAADHPPVPGRALAEVTSEQCKQCHDGWGAVAVRTRDVRSPSLVSTDESAIERERRSGHPVAVNYARAQARRHARLRPVAALDPVIRLEEGKVGCVSCHDLTSARRGKLATPARGGLCAGCHDM